MVFEIYFICRCCYITLPVKFYIVGILHKLCRFSVLHCHHEFLLQVIINFYLSWVAEFFI